MRTKTIAGGLSAICAIAALILAGCGGSRPTASAAGQSTSVVLRELAACFRAHGLPAFPDPVVGRDGIARFPDRAPRTSSSEQRACSAIANRLPATYTSPPPVLSPAKYREYLRFAACVRANGYPSWPDPTTRGQFILPSNIQGDVKTVILTAQRHCERLKPR